MNKDRTPDVAVSAFTSSEIKGTVHGIDGKTGEEIWNQGTGMGFQGIPALGDVTGNGFDDVVIGTVLEPRLYAFEGQKGETLWTFKGLDLPRGETVLNWARRPAFADVTGNGSSEIIIRGTTASNSSTQQDHIFVIRDDQIWPQFGKYVTHVAASGMHGKSSSPEDIHTISVDDPVRSSPTAGHLTEQGPVNVVFGADDGVVRAVDGVTGKTRWEKPTGHPIHGSPALVDLNNNGILDVVIANGTTSTVGLLSEGLVQAYDGRDGTHLWTFGDEEGMGAVTTSPVVADLEPDGVPDVIVGSEDHTLYALEGDTGEIKWTFLTRGPIRSTTALVDLTENNVLDAVVGSDDGFLYLIDGKTGEELSSSLSETESLLYPLFTGSPVRSTTAVANFWRDSTNVQITFGTLDGRVHALSPRGGFAEGWIYHTDSEVTLSPAIGDLTGSGDKEVVVGDADGRVHAITGPGNIFNQDATDIWTRPVGSQVTTPPVLADLTGDGLLDVIAGTDEGELHALRGEDGAELWVKILGSGSPLRTSPALAEINGSGSLEIIIGSDEGNVHVVGWK